MAISEHLARQALEQGDWQTAAQHFARLAEGYQARGDALRAAEARNNQATALLLGGQVQQALQLLQPLPEVFLRHGEPAKAALAWGNLALALEKAGQFAQAQEAYQRSLERLPQDPAHRAERAAVHRGLARVLARRGRWKPALEHITAALLLEPRNPLERLLRWWLLRWTQAHPR